MSKYVGKRDSNGLVIAGALILCVLFVVVVHYVTFLLPLWIFLFGTIAVQLLFIVPKVVKEYYELHNVDAPVTRFIPFYNEIILFQPKYAIACIVMCIVTILTFLVSQVPLSIVQSLFGMKASLGWGYSCITLGVIFLVIAHFMIGIGLNTVLSNINFMTLTCIGERPGRLGDMAYRVCAFVPAVQIVTCISMYTRQNTLIKYGYGSEQEEDFVEDTKN